MLSIVLPINTEVSKASNGYLLIAFFMVIVVLAWLAWAKKYRARAYRRVEDSATHMTHVMTIGRAKGAGKATPFVSIRPIIPPLEAFTIDYTSGKRGLCVVTKESGRNGFSYIMLCSPEDASPRPIALMRDGRLASVFVAGSFFPQNSLEEGTYDLFFCGVYR
ncbi:MAG: hypothetical protein PHS79_06145 [Patescibacteria group bacterium]|nr:hypothetical protein [Patescibacteria group bacterium]